MRVPYAYTSSVRAIWRGGQLCNVNHTCLLKGSVSCQLCVHCLLNPQRGHSSVHQCATSDVVMWSGLANGADCGEYLSSRSSTVCLSSQDISREALLRRLLQSSLMRLVSFQPRCRLNAWRGARLRQVSFRPSLLTLRLASN